MMERLREVNNVITTGRRMDKEQTRECVCDDDWRERESGNTQSVNTRTHTHDQQQPQPMGSPNSSSTQ